MKTMHIVTYVDADPSSSRDAEALLKQYRNATAEENGNSAVLVLREKTRPNRFVIVESWKDEPSFQAHETASHTTDFRTNLSAIHNSPIRSAGSPCLQCWSRNTPAGPRSAICRHPCRRSSAAARRDRSFAQKSCRAQSDR